MKISGTLFPGERREGHTHKKTYSNGVLPRNNKYQDHKEDKYYGISLPTYAFCKRQ